MAKKKVSSARKRCKSARRRAVEKTHVKALDAIPATGVRFGKAYELVLERYRQKPKAGTFHEFWRGNIDPDKTLREDEIDLEAEYLFRQLLDVGELHGCVLHPSSGETLHLAPDIWLSEPSEFDGDYLVPNESSRGNGAEIGGSLRPVFFRIEEFDGWLKRTFDEPASEERILRSNRSRPAEMAVRLALRNLYPEDGHWALLNREKLLEQVNEFIKSRNLTPVSMKSLNRTIGELKKEGA